MKLKKIILIISIIILLLMSSCSLRIDGYARQVGYNSICWEDNDHILVYANIGAYDDYITIGGGARSYIWIGGEIWRIDVSTGDKELLMRKKESEYAMNIDYVEIDIVNNRYFICDNDYTFEMKNDFNDWDTIGNFRSPEFDINAIYAMSISELESGDNLITKYNIIEGTKELIYDNTDRAIIIDYDYNRNLLLINNIKLVDLNTGEETVLIDNGDIIDGHMINDYRTRYGQIENEYILIDAKTYNNDEYSKVFINVDSLTDKRLVYGLRGKQSPNGEKYACGWLTHVEIFNGFGVLLQTIKFPIDEI